MLTEQPNGSLRACRRLPSFGPPVPSRVRPPTGEPDAGDPHVRFGGRGDRSQSVLPTPMRNRGNQPAHGAYWLILTMRDAIPNAHSLAKAEFATVSLRLFKLSARV